MQWIAQGLRKSDASEAVMVVDALSDEQARVEASQRGLLVESVYQIGAKPRRSWWPLISLLLISSCFAGITWTQIEQRKDRKRIQELSRTIENQSKVIDQHAKLLNGQKEVLGDLITSSMDQKFSVNDAHRRIDVIVRALR